MTGSEIYLTQSADIASRTLGDDTIIMSTLDSTVYMLNAVGTAIWNGADGATPLSAIVEERVCANFEVTREQAITDAQEFVKELSEHKILCISDSPLEAKGTP